MGTLYVVATPIGNLEDITARAVRILHEVSLIAAEDTRHTGRLLKHFEITSPLLSYHAHNERARRDTLLAALADGDVALVSDAGTPGIADPGYDLVTAAIAGGHNVVPIPGPTALIAAVSASGLVPGPFVALGFLPRKGEERRSILGRVAASGFPMVLYESPQRLAATLADLAAVLGNRQAAIGRELTKLHEEIRRGPLLDLAAHYESKGARGEIVVVVGPPIAAHEVDPADARQVLAHLLDQNLGPSRAAREAATITGLPRSELYTLARELGQGNRTKD